MYQTFSFHDTWKYATDCECDKLQINCDPEEIVNDEISQNFSSLVVMTLIKVIIDEWKWEIKHGCESKSESKILFEIVYL